MNKGKIMTGVLTLAVACSVLYSQTTSPRTVVVEESELSEAADLTNTLARVRLISGGKIVRLNKLVETARQSMSDEVRKDVERANRLPLITVYADGTHSNLCWIGFTAERGDYSHFVEFDHTGRVVKTSSLKTE